jgi:hypothetical protein
VSSMSRLTEGWQRSVTFAAIKRPHPTFVEATLPRMRQVGESASPRLDAGWQHAFKIQKVKCMSGISTFETAGHPGLAVWEGTERG